MSRKPKQTEAQRHALAVQPPAAEYRLVPIDQVHTSPLNPRTRHKGRQDATLDELAQSIATEGVIEAIVVRPRVIRLDNGQHRQEGFEVVAGNRRRRAAGLAGLAEIPVTIRDVTDQQLLELALAENVHRADMDALDEADALAKLQDLDPMYRDLKTLATKVGRSESHVRDRLRLRRLDSLVTEALDANAITLRHAELIAKLTPDQHPRALEECFSKLLTVGKSEWVPRAKAVAERQWEALSGALLGPRELEKFVAECAKADVTAPEIQEQLREVVEEEARADDKENGDGEDTVVTEHDVEEATAKLLQLSDTSSYKFTRNDARAARVVHKSDWKAAKPGSCKYVRKGIVVHPAGVEPRVLDVCTSKSCTKHHPKRQYDMRSGGMYGETAAQAKARKGREAKQEAERKAWEQDRPQYRRALAALVGKRKYSLLELAKIVLGSWSLSQLKREYGLTLSPTTAATCLVLSEFPEHNRAEFMKEAKARGISEKALLGAIAPAARTGSAAKAKSVKRGKKAAA